jgi:hypothetical protein
VRRLIASRLLLVLVLLGDVARVALYIMVVVEVVTLSKLTQGAAQTEVTAVSAVLHHKWLLQRRLLWDMPLLHYLYRLLCHQVDPLPCLLSHPITGQVLLAFTKNILHFHQTSSLLSRSPRSVSVLLFRLELPKKRLEGTHRELDRPYLELRTVRLELLQQLRSTHRIWTEMHLHTDAIWTGSIPCQLCLYLRWTCRTGACCNRSRLLCRLRRVARHPHPAG